MHLSAGALSRCNMVMFTVIFAPVSYFIRLRSNVQARGSGGRAAGN